MEVEECAALGRCLYFVSVPIIWLFMCRGHLARVPPLAFMCPFILCWLYWQQRQMNAYTAHVKKYGQPPLHCQQVYKFPWRSVGDSSSEECEAYLLAIGSTQLPHVDPFYLFLCRVAEAVVVLLGKLGVIGKLGIVLVRFANPVLFFLLLRRAEQLHDD